MKTSWEAWNGCGVEVVLGFLWLAAMFDVSSGLYLPRRRATICNGRSELCGRSYGSTSFLTSHNAFAWSPNPLALARTQAVDVPVQLRMGARVLQAQSHMKDGRLHFCHTSKHIFGLFDGGSVLDFLRKVKTWLDANPYEVVSFIFTNPENVSIPGVWKPIFDEAGITPLAYVPPARPMKRTDWPTLSEMIDANKRVVVFMDKGADGSAGGVVDFVLPQFQMIWEDPFSPTDPNFPCRIHRIEGPLEDNDHMHLINHNLNRNIIPWDLGTVLVSDFVNSPKTNSMNSIMAHVAGCAPFAQGRAPNFVLLDYLDVGDGKRAVDQLNGF
ncbi:PLC-like phosphodiesterase [Coprinopsis marcescibilis]|uniref:PLC-like phosphodiesterase n=1 Tax=Coprinopsis marcescibilis TaxID=230819 RepID=A0A5C3KJ39_COPMA|nr:PLC-like phosphodiesterase [Coprinopsis marcescibilis]